MFADFVTVICLAVYLPIVFALHAAWYRMDPSLQKSPAQGPAIKVVGFGAILIVALLAVLLPRDAEWLPHMLFSGLGIASLGTFYFTFLCVSESGRRYFLLTLLARSEKPLSRDELAARYGKDYMIEVRLGRLITWGVVEESNGRLFLKKQSFYIYSAFFHLWAQLLGYRWFNRSNS
jgi:hypothetical protein